MESTIKLTPTQLAIYFESADKAGKPVYVIPVMYTLNAAIDVAKLAAAVQAAFRNYPVLTSTLAEGADGMPYLNAGDGTMSCDIVEIGDDEFKRLYDELPRAPRLDGGPLHEVTIYKTPSATYLYIATHHIISDGTTLHLLLNAIIDAYNGRELTPEPMTIADICAADEALAASPVHDEAKRYYAEITSGIESESTPLPDILALDEADERNDKVSFASRRLNVSYDELFAFSRAIGVPLSVVLDGAFGYMAGVWNGADEAVFATVFAGRNDERERAVAGMMVQTIPAICRWDNDTAVADYLRELAEQRKNARRYSRAFSFAEFCTTTGVRPALNFSYRGSVQNDNLVIDGFITGSKYLGLYGTGDALQLLVDHVGNGLLMSIEYPAGKYTEKFIDNYMQAYETVLSQIARADKLSQLQLRKALPRHIDRPYHDDEPLPTIVKRVRMFAGRTPDKTAAKGDNFNLTYGRLMDIADRLAARISSMGIGRGDAVAIMPKRDEAMVAATIGVLCSGAAYEPLDASYPAERLNFMMRDAAVRLLIIDRDIDFALEPDLRDKVAILYTDELAALPQGNVPEGPKLEDPFILLYTSGTTGVPKGVVLTHDNLSAFCAACNIDLPEITGADDVWSMYASYGFDAGFFSMLLPLSVGGATCVVPDEIRLDMDALNEFYMRHGVTSAFMTTQVGRIFATSVEHTTIKALCVGGEKLVPCEPPKGYDLYNLYGPTEGTVFCNFKLVDKLYSRVPIGDSLYDYRMYIVDKHGRLMPDGALGELLISGPQVARGYLNLPEKTAAVFCPNPFSDDPDYERVYHTGDIVRILPATGEADIIGRNDGQVKIRGFRIELSEVEKAVREFPGITDATVQAFDSPAGGKFIAAYVVADEEISTEALATFIAASKPPYMVPEVIMQIPAIPLTQNQKVDKRSLPAPVYTPSAEPEETVSREPNILEKTIMAIVADLLGTNDISLSTPLAYLGLTSISSIRLVAMLHKRFGVVMRGADLVKGATVLTIEDAILEHWLQEANGPTAADANELRGLTAAPLTVSQQGVFADTQRDPSSVAYNIPLCLTFDKSVGADRLADAVKRVMQAHPYVYNARIVMGSEDVEQSIVPPTEFEIPVRQMSVDEFNEYKATYVRPFDLMKAPLCHLEVVDTKEAVHLLVDIHHIVFDGSSLSVMLAQLKQVLEGGEAEPEGADYLNYALYEQCCLQGEEGARARDFFATMLADCEAASDIPSDLPGATDGGERGIVTCPIDMDAIAAFCRGHELTPAALMLAATCYATARLTTSRSAYISTISTGRSNPVYADTFGMFVKTLPIGLAIGDDTAGDLARRAKEALEGAVANEIYPYAKICADYGYAPNIVYEYQYGLIDDLTIGGHRVESTPLDADTLKFRMSVRVEDDGRDGAFVAVHYRKGLYSERLAGAFCRGIAAVAGEIVATPEMKATSLSLLAPGDAEIIEKLSVSALDEPSNLCFHQLMEKQAAEHPERKAVVASDRTLTYRELNELATVVAANLQARGIGKGDRVVLLLNRTSRFFTSLYGVLKTGAAYIPSSPEYPEERIRSIVEDSGAKLVITDAVAEELHQGSTTAYKPVEVTPDDTVYLIYTSGSTGKPKGVVLRHRGIVNYVSPYPSNIHTHAIATTTRVVGSITTVAFDMALKEWGIALSNGLTVVFADDNQANDPVALARLFADNGVDYFNTTPSRMMQYMELDEFRDMLRGCKVVICGAEKYPEQLLGMLREAAPEAELFNTYGPTEITVSCNACRLTESDSVSVGRPLHNYVEWIVDADGNLLPPGATGELVIAGSNIAKGYDGAPELTAKAFIERDSLPAYLSGDYARWDEQGNVVILGRKDTQVKLRGLRIELGEIVRVMGDVEGVGAVHVMIRNVAGRENLVGYYTLKPGADLTAEQLKAAMAERLTDYMVPSFLVEMERMPLTPNGKIDTRSLPEPAVGEREAGREAANDLERLFVDAFKAILATDTVYATDNFFQIGGSSLTATRIMIAASKAGHRILYSDIFAHPTPEGLARCVAANEGIASDSADDQPAEEAYDYTAIDGLLSRNTLQSFRDGQLREPGTVMLTGATGFAGIHVLHELLVNYPASRVVCLVRDSRRGIPARQRLEGLWFYYFGYSLEERYGDRLSVIASDITLVTPDFDPGERVDTVINCAAVVKHFSAGTDIEDVNLHGVERLIEWCKRSGAVLVQTSTISVSGMIEASKSAVLTEQSLEIGQDLGGNKYTVSKFRAERAVLEATARGEITGKVVRLGNLAPRERDGEFQINFTTNGFMNRLKSMVIIGCYPYASYNQQKDISPIDDVARAIVMFSRTPAACCLFHANNPNRYSLGNFYHEAALAGLNIRPVETEEYNAALDEAKNNPATLGALVGLMAYDTLDDSKRPVDYSNAQSAQILLRMGMHWPVVSSDYVAKLVRALDTLAFFQI